MISGGAVHLADITGNRRAGLIFQGVDNQFWISLADGAGGLGTLVQSIKHGGPFVSGQVHLADITGNGRADLIFQGVDNRMWVSLADGQGGLSNPQQAAVP